MTSRITKIAAAAVIIAAVALSLSIWNKTTPTAYALGQTIEANHTVLSLHIRDFKPGENEPKEFWVECDPSGRVTGARLAIPDWASHQDGAKVAVWKDNQVQIWFKKKGAMLIARDQTTAMGMLRMVESSDPRLAVERLSEQEKQGLVKLEVNQPSDKTQPITVTATYLPGSPSPEKRQVLLVDQATKLVTVTKSYLLKDGQYQHTDTQEYSDYNQPIEPSMFTLDDVPADVTRVDQVAQEVGLVQGSLSDNEVAVEVVRQFFTALIAEDYAAAGKLFEGVPVEKMRELFSPIKVVRIISVGPAGPHSIPQTKGLAVPCTVEVLKDGQTSEWKLDGVGVRQVFNQPGRWTIFGGI